MKKRILALLLTWAMVLSLMSVRVLAANIPERESNNTFGTAQSISANDFVEGNLATSNDVDYYKVSLPSPGYISLTFNHEYVSNSMTAWYVTLYNGDNKELVKYSFAGTNTKNDSNPIGVPAGTYYAKVSNNNYPSSVPYELKINYTASSAWETEFNDSFATANTISSNTTISGSLMDSGDVDFYKVTLSSPGYISMTFNHDYVNNSMVAWYVTLYNGDNKELVKYSFAGTNTKNDSNPIGVPAGSYYAKVSNNNYLSSVPYELKFNYTASDAWEKEFNDSFATANVISPNVAVNGSLMKSGDVDYYKVTLSSSGNISLAFDHEYVSSNMTAWYVTLYDADNKELVKYSFAGTSTKNDSNSISVSAGTYYAKVSNNNYPSNVKYTLTIKTQQDSKFTDVQSSAFYADAVFWAVEKGITAGTSNTTFSPNKDCTRAEIVTFLWRAAGSPEPSSTRNPFTDVPSGQYYTKAVLWAVEKGITAGTTATTFNPSKTCTRGEAVTFLYRYAGKPSISGSNPFKDVASGQFYYSPVLWAVAKGVTAGTSTTTFSPSKTCSRGEIVTFLYRYLK